MIAERLKAARAALGLTQLQAAERLGVPLRTYQGWEVGDGADQLHRGLRVGAFLASVEGANTDTDTHTDEETARG